MSYLLALLDKDNGAIRYTRVPDHLASFAAQEVMNEGHRLIGIQNTKDSEPLLIEHVEQSRAAKAAWRKAYGKDIYAVEEAWYRRELRHVSLLV